MTSSQPEPSGHGSHVAVLRLRLGVGLFVASWLPIPQLYVWIAGLKGSAASEARLIGWGIEWTVGIIGLILAGAAAKTVLKRVGWRGLPRVLWTMLRTGAIPVEPPDASGAAQIAGS
jgi:hypothetical protein